MLDGKYHQFSTNAIIHVSIIKFPNLMRGSGHFHVWIITIIERKNYLWSWYHLLVDWRCPSGIDVIINDSLIIKFPDLKRGGRPLSCVDNKAVVNIISTTGAAIKADNHRREKSLHNLHQVFCFFKPLMDQNQWTATQASPITPPSRH